MTLRISAGALSTFTLVVLAAGSASAQDRPTLERIEASICAQTDAEGLGYRPIFCEPKCDCLFNESLSDAASCEQQPSGDVRVRLRTTTYAWCAGTCLLVSTVQVGACLFDTDCATTCSYSRCTPLKPGLGEMIQCLGDADCDQAKGYACSEIDPTNLPGVKYCLSTSCAVVGECDTGVEMTYSAPSFGFAPAGDIDTPLRCSGTGKHISSTDVAECITQVEAVVGAGACIICGDGNDDPGEQCDDGNVDPGDGCAPDCTTE